MNLKKILILLSLLIFTPTLGEELKKENFSDHELNFYSGMFDFSDDGKRSTIFGIQHQDVEVQIDEETLQDIATITDGKYFRATNNKLSLIHI